MKCDSIGGNNGKLILLITIPWRDLPHHICPPLLMAILRLSVFIKITLHV